jgi:hypothetical protein
MIHIEASIAHTVYTVILGRSGTSLTHGMTARAIFRVGVRVNCAVVSRPVHIAIAGTVGVPGGVVNTGVAVEGSVAFTPALAFRVAHGFSLGGLRGRSALITIESI